MPTLDGRGAPGLHPDRYSLDETRAMAAELDGGWLHPARWIIALKMSGGQPMDG
jgi:hypothetical protein